MWIAVAAIPNGWKGFLRLQPDVKKRLMDWFKKLSTFRGLLGRSGWGGGGGGTVCARSCINASVEIVSCIKAGHMKRKAGYTMNMFHEDKGAKVQRFIDNNHQSPSRPL